MTRWQRNELRGSRPDVLDNPRSSTHTAKSYVAKYLRGQPNASHSRLMRMARLIRRESHDE